MTPCSVGTAAMPGEFTGRREKVSEGCRKSGTDQGQGRGVDGNVRKTRGRGRNPSAFGGRRQN